MPEAGGSRTSGAPGRGDPGSISALLAEIARTGGPAWETGLAPGDRVGHFEVLREIGRGGFGVVYEALDRDLGRHVAVKALRPERRGSEEAAERLHREAEAAARLDHPGLVTLLEAGVAERGPWLATELLRGETLAARLLRGPLPPAEAVAAGLKVARALGHAHARNVLHRDLKPANVFLTDDGRVKILDLGLAHLLGTPEGPCGGTPAYMAPEQARGEAVDARADVFSLGATLFEMVAGRPPFAVREGRSGVLDGDAPAWPPDLPGPVARLLARLLAADPARRPAGGQAAAEELLQVQRRLERPGKRRHALLLLGLGLAAGLVVAAASKWFPFGPEPPPAAPGARIAVAVADVANTTGEPELDALSGLLVTSLEQSRRLTVLTRGRMADLARQAGLVRPGRLGPELAREVARRAGAPVLLLPAVWRAGGRYAIVVQAVDPGRDALLFEAAEEGEGQSSVPALLDRLGERIRRALREGEPELAIARVQVAAAVTSSLEAYGHYARAEELTNVSFDGAAALAEYRRALEIDPDFALAHLGIALMAIWHEAPDEDEEVHIAAAAKQAARLPEKERRLVLGVARYLRRDFAGASQILRDLARDHPQDKEVQYLAGEALWHEASPAGPAEAAQLFRRALDLDPAFLVAAVHLFQWLGRFGPSDEAVTRANRSARLRPGPAAEAMLARALAFAGLLPRAEATARRAVAASRGAHFEASYALAELLFARGRNAEAEREIRRWTGPGAAAGDRRIALEFLPVLLASEGRRREALEAWTELAGVRCGPDCEYYEELMRIHLLLGGGDLAAARQALREWRPHNPASADPHAWLWAFTGDLEGAAERAARLPRGSLAERRHAGAAALQQGKPGEAAAILEDVARRDPALESVFLWGQALAAEGRDAEAVRAFEAVEGTYPLYAPLWQASLRPWAVYLAARSHQRLGHRAEALGAIDRLLVLWGGADGDLPLLAEARALRRQLAPGR